MSVTIERTHWIDDDGSGTTGTVLNNAIKTELYGQIDGALAQLAPGSNGLLNITEFGTNQIVAGGAGGQILVVRNSAAGSGNYTQVQIGNDISAQSLALIALSSTYTTSGAFVTNGNVIYAEGTGGLSIQSSNPSGAIRFYTGGTTERMRLGADGKLAIGPIAAGTGKVSISCAHNAEWNMGLYSTVDTPGGCFVNFQNASVVTQGAILATNSTTTAYNTTSDQRLKEDLGVAEDLTALRAVVVHDFIWSAHGGHDRGVFAQETFPVFPRAISIGSPGTDLSKPWMTDYSKFVPDLIVGWQEHDRRLARLESLVNERR